jgi:hypothetical protein
MKSEAEGGDGKPNLLAGLMGGGTATGTGKPNLLAGLMNPTAEKPPTTP